MMYQVVFKLFAIFMISVLIEARNHEEPTCSKYDFEEKVLEKLVRLEHNLELHHTQLKGWEDKMEIQLKAINEAEVVRTNNITTTKVTIQQELKRQQTKLGEVLTNFQQQVVRLSNDLVDKETHVNKTLLTFVKNQETALNNFKAELVTPTIVFKARKVTDKNPTTGSKMIFGEIVTNIGGGYDASTGFFTVPRDGTYLFTVQICTHIKKWLRLHLVAANKIIGTLSYYEDDAAYTCTSGTGVAVLSTGDTVWVKCSTANSNAVSENDDIWNSFSGFLINN